MVRCLPSRSHYHTIHHHSCTFDWFAHFRMPRGYDTMWKLFKSHLYSVLWVYVSASVNGVCIANNVVACFTGLWPFFSLFPIHIYFFLNAFCVDAALLLLLRFDLLLHTFYVQNFRIELHSFKFHSRTTNFLAIFLRDNRSLSLSLFRHFIYSETNGSVWKSHGTTTTTNMNA